MTEKTEPLSDILAYSRASSEEQKVNALCVPYQRKRHISAFKSDGVEKYQLMEDDGYSGFYIDDRPDFKQILRWINEGKVRELRVCCLDRLSRRLKDYLEIKEKIQQNKVRLISYDEHIDSHREGSYSAMNILNENIRMSFAEAERNQTRDRTISRMNEMAKDGKLLFKLPYGYKPIKKLINDKIKVVKWIISAKEANKVREAFKLKIEGKSVAEISKVLKLPYTSLVHILQNKAYTGIQKWRDFEYKGDYEPILDIETFEKAQIKNI